MSSTVEPEPSRRTDVRVQPDALARPSTAALLAIGLQRFGAAIVLVLVVAVSAVALPGFFSLDNMQNVAQHSSYLGLIVIGQTLVIISGGIDLSVGSMLGFAGVIAALAATRSWELAIALPIAVGAAYGALNGVLIAKARMPPF